MSDSQGEKSDPSPVPTESGLVQSKNPPFPKM